MAFVNEKVLEEDKVRIEPVMNHKKIEEQVGWCIPEYSTSYRWTVDREQDVYLVFLTGNGREGDPYYALGIKGQSVVFNACRGGTGDHMVGIKEYFVVSNLFIPSCLESSREKIKKLISESLEEYAYFRAFADGNPDTITRWNIVSFHVEFKSE
jgi:hypothetical protein